MRDFTLICSGTRSSVSCCPSNPEIGVATVAAEAGHAQLSTTLAIYTQVYDKRRKEIRSQLSKELYE